VGWEHFRDEGRGTLVGTPIGEGGMPHYRRRSPSSTALRSRLSEARSVFISCLDRTPASLYSVANTLVVGSAAASQGRRRPS